MSKLGKVVYTYGVFDLFHVGHLKLLREARALGGYLIVGVFSDEVAASFKRAPIIPFAQRMAIVEALFDVNEVIGQHDYSPNKNIELLKPQILAKAPGAGWDIDNDKQPGQEAIEAIGGKAILLDYHAGVSTSGIIERIKAL